MRNLAILNSIGISRTCTESVVKFQRDVQPHDRLSAQNYLFLLHMEKSEDQGMTFANEFLLENVFLSMFLSIFKIVELEVILIQGSFGIYFKYQQ